MPKIMKLMAIKEAFPDAWVAVNMTKVGKDEGDTLLDAFLSVCEWQTVYYAWRPNVPDEADNHVVELTVAGEQQQSSPRIRQILCGPSCISLAYVSYGLKISCRRKTRWRL